MRSLKQSLLAGCALTLLVGGVAHAQAPQTAVASDATSAGAVQSAQAPSATAGAAVAPVPDGGIQEVVVTAQKTRQSLQKTAAAVTALTPDALQERGVVDLSQIQALIPGARFQVEGNVVQLFLRGVGSNLDFGNIETTVAYNTNGMYVPREGSSIPLFDIAQIEVLPGPQGTLYGRGSVGGAVNVEWNRPELGVYHSHLEEVMGNYEKLNGTAVQNIPIGDDLAVRVGFATENHSGYITDGSWSQHDMEGHLGILWKPSTNFTAYIWGEMAGKNGHQPNLVNKGTDPATGAYSETSYLQSNPWNNTVPLAYDLLGEPYAENQTYINRAIGGEFTYRLENTTFTYIPTYFYLDDSPYYFLGQINSFKVDVYRQLTQEFRVAHDFDALKLIGGLYWYHQNGHNSYDIYLPGILPGNGDDPQSNMKDNVKEGEAVYGQGTYSVFDDWRLILGGRYSADQRSADGLGVASLPTFAPQPFTFSHHYYNTDFKVGTEYDVARNILAYGAIQSAYQPGTFNDIVSGIATDPQAVKSEHLFAFTAGFKSRFLDNKLQINDEAFYYTYHNLTQQAYSINGVNLIFNAKQVQIPGNQLDILYKFLPDDQFGLSVAYNHARNKNFITPGGQNFDGFQSVYAADWTANIGYQHNFEIESGAIRFRADTRIESSFYGDFQHDPGTFQPTAVKLDMSLTYYDASGDWSVGAWVKNATNEAAIAATAFAGIPGPATAYLQEPMTFGLRASQDF